jgi:hypothetical protein
MIGSTIGISQNKFAAGGCGADAARTNGPAKYARATGSLANGAAWPRRRRPQR